MAYLEYPSQQLSSNVRCYVSHESSRLSVCISSVALQHCTQGNVCQVLFSTCSVSGCHFAWRDSNQKVRDLLKKRKRKDNSWLMRELLTDNSRSFSSLKFAINHRTGVALAAAASNFSRCIYRSNLRTLMVRGVTSIKLESDTGDDVVDWDRRDVNRGFLSCKVC